MKIQQIEEAYNRIKSGGLAIIPSRVGYVLLGNSERSIKKMFEIKNRPLSKPAVILTKLTMIKELAEAPDSVWGIIRKIDYNHLLCGVVLKRKNGRFYKSLSEWTSEHSQKDGTSCFVINGGEYLDYLVNKSEEDEILIVGSSANISGEGNEGNFSRLSKKIINNVDYVIEDDLYVMQEYDPSTRERGAIVNFSSEKIEVLRKGLFYDKIAGILKNDLQ